MFKSGWRYSDEACRTFPRYRLDAAIQMEVERLTPDCEANLEQLRTRLVRACDVAEMRFQQELTNSLEREAIHEEAEDFRASIRVGPL